MKEKAAFEEKIHAKPIIKKDKNADINKGIMKLYFNGGKKKKIRAVDFVGTIAKIKGVTAEDIGIITIQDNVSYVEILNGKGPLVLKVMKTTTIKGKQLKVHEVIIIKTIHFNRWIVFIYDSFKSSTSCSAKRLYILLIVTKDVSSRNFSSFVSSKEEISFTSVTRLFTSCLKLSTLLSVRAR